jgi:molecular chaperone GrpE
MIEKNPTTSSRIPVRFVDDEDREGGQRGETEPEELGRASSYEDETEMRRRIDRGGESDAEGERERADDADVAGSPPDSELPDDRTDQDTQPRRAQGPADGQGARPEPSQPSQPPSSQPSASTSAQPSAGVSAEAQLFAAQAEAQVLEEEVKRLKVERQELIDLMARRQADFDNFRKRNERERSETYSRVAGEVAGRILPVLDNLRRAVAAEASFEASESKEFREFLHGVELISRQLNGVLEDLGVVPVPTVGHPFDPHVHEAVATERTEEYEPDTVVQEIQRGYRIGEKLLRPAMVKVATR